VGASVLFRNGDYLQSGTVDVTDDFHPRLEFLNAVVTRLVMMCQVHLKRITVSAWLDTRKVQYIVIKLSRGVSCKYCNQFKFCN